MEIKDILLRNKIFGGFTILFWVIGFLMYGNFVYGDKFLDFGWWILSFNFLLLVTFAVSWFRERAHLEDKTIQDTIRKEINSKLKEEINENEIKKKLKTHDDVRELFILNQVFPKDLILKSLIRSVFYVVLYILLFLVFSKWVNQKVVGDVFIANVVFLYLFLGSFYYLLKGAIDMAFFFKSQD